MNDEQKRNEALKKIKDDVLALTDSPLYQYRVNPVIGEGSHFATIMFVGEAPGKNESLTGRPFCGASGKFFDTMLASINMERKNVYVTNIVKDRPPENRDPTPAEIALYTPFLARQIDIIQPKVIVTLGRFSMNYIMDTFKAWETPLPISKIHGKVFQARTGYGQIDIVPLYHPAVALYSGSMRGALLKDFEVLKKYI